MPKSNPVHLNSAEVKTQGQNCWEIQMETQPGLARNAAQLCHRLLPHQHKQPVSPSHKPDISTTAQYPCLFHDR